MVLKHRIIAPRLSIVVLGCCAAVLGVLGLGALREPSVPRSAPEASRGAAWLVRTGKKRAAHGLTAAAVPSVSVHPALTYSDLPEPLRELFQQTLNEIPAACSDTLTNVYVQFDQPDQRAYSGKYSMVLYGGFDLSDAVTRDMVRALLIHECGHIIDLGHLRGEGRGNASAFRDGREVLPTDDPSLGFYQISWIDDVTQRPGSRSDDFVSGYAATNPFEDWAETFAFVVTQPELAMQRSQENDAIALKVQWMIDHVLRDVPVLAQGKADVSNGVPWDVTLLPYEWLGSREVAVADDWQAQVFVR